MTLFIFFFDFKILISNYTLPIALSPIKFEHQEGMGSRHVAKFLNLIIEDPSVPHYFSYSSYATAWNYTLMLESATQYTLSQIILSITTSLSPLQLATHPFLTEYLQLLCIYKCSYLRLLFP